MTEEEWLACVDPRPMLEFVGGGGRAGDRKLRLFAAACCRRLGRLLADARSRAAVEVAERAAEGGGDARALARASRLALYAVRAAEDRRAAAAVHAACSAALGAVAPRAGAAAFIASSWTARASGHLTPDSPLPGCGNAEQATLLREFYGNPLRPAWADPGWLAWGSGTVTKVARVIYDEGRFEDLPVLADALEEAGCQDEDVLRHCRRPGDHLRGCWLVDALLGRG